jgi:hypothetical protein
MNELTPTSGAQWRRETRDGFVVQLPSGNVVKMRPVALDVMITNGDIPDLLTPVAAKTLWKEMDANDIGDAVELATGVAELFGIVCKASFVDPCIVDNPQVDNEISLDDIDFYDKAFVFQMATRGVSELKKFCERQARGMESVQPDEDSKHKAK